MLRSSRAAVRDLVVDTALAAGIASVADILMEVAEGIPAEEATAAVASIIARTIS